MKLNRTKNGFKITVKDWSNEVVVRDLHTGEIHKVTFSDHVMAILAAKKL